MTALRTHRLTAVFALILLVALTSLVASSGAADPENGKVSAASPTVKWTGEAFGPMGIPYAEGTDGNCDQPTCDTFTLEVADGPATLTFTLKTTNYSNVEFEVEKPDGTRIYETTDENVDTRKTVIKDAPSGTYKVYTWPYSLGAGPMEYEGSVVRAGTTGNATPDPSATATATASATPTGSSTPTPSAQPGSPTLSITAGRLSARKLSKSRKAAATLKSTGGAVNNLTVQLFKGKRVVATGKLAKLNGSAKVSLKLRGKGKIKRGSYSLFASGRDDQGRSVTATRKVRVKK